RFLLCSLPIRLDFGQRLVRLALGLGIGFRLLLRFLLGLSKGGSIRLGLALCRFLSCATDCQGVLIALTGFGLALCLDARLQFTQLLLGLLPRLLYLFQVGVGLPLGFGVRFGPLARLLLQPTLVGRERVGLPTFGQYLLELLSAQIERRRCDGPRLVGCEG